jgi:hypothetical protein
MEGLRRLAMQAGGSAEKTLEMLRRNKTAREAIERKIRKLDERIARLEGIRERRATKARWNEKSFVIEIQTAQTKEAMRTATGFAKACFASGFCPRLFASGKRIIEKGIQIECDARMAARALLIQGAFRIAGLPAMLTVHSDARPEVVTVYVGDTEL